MPRQKGRAVAARNQRRDLRRQKPRKLGFLTLDGFEPLGVRNGDGRLVGERGDELQLRVAERTRVDSPKSKYPAQLSVDEDRCAHQRADLDDYVLACVRVIVVLE